MKKENPIFRTCVLCRNKSTQSALHRFYYDSEKALQERTVGEILGRSAYLCNNCIPYFYNDASKEHQKIIFKLTHELTKTKKHGRK